MVDREIYSKKEEVGNNEYFDIKPDNAIETLHINNIFLESSSASYYISDGTTDYLVDDAFIGAGVSGDNPILLNSTFYLRIKNTAGSAKNMAAIGYIL